MRIGATGPHAPVQLRSMLLWLLFLLAPLALSHAFLLPSPSSSSSSQGTASSISTSSSTTAGSGCHIGGGSAVGAPLCYREGSLAPVGELGGEVGGEANANANANRAVKVMVYREEGVLLASAATTTGPRTHTLHTPHKAAPTGRRDRGLEEGGVCVSSSSPYGSSSSSSSSSSVGGAPSLSHSNGNGNGDSGESKSKESKGDSDSVDRDVAQWRKKRDRAKRSHPHTPPQALLGLGAMSIKGQGPLPLPLPEGQEQGSGDTRARLLAYTRRLKSLSRSHVKGKGNKGSKGGEAWHVLVVEMLGEGGVAPDLIALNTALHALAQGGRWRECLSLLLSVSPSLSSLPPPLLPPSLSPLPPLKALGLEGDVVTWNSVLNGLARAHMHTLSLELLQHMTTHGPTPNEVTFGAVLDACRRCNDWQAALHTLHTHMPHAQLHPNTLHYSVVLEACVRGGRLDQALSLYNQARTAQPPPTLDAQLYNCLAREACGRGRVKEGLAPLLNDMQSVGVLPDGGWWSSAMEGAAHAPQQHAAHTAHAVCELFYATWRKTRRRPPPLTPQNPSSERDPTPPIPTTQAPQERETKANTPAPAPASQEKAKEKEASRKAASGSGSGEGEAQAVVALASLGNATVTHYLRALTKGRQPRRATQAYEVLLSQGVVLDTRAHTAAITAYAHTQQPHKARVCVEEVMVQHRALPDPTTYAALTHAYTQGGLWSAALEVLQEESHWAGAGGSVCVREGAVGVLLGTLADKGRADEALTLLRWWHEHGGEGQGKNERRLRVMGARACVGGGKWNEAHRLLVSAAGVDHRGSSGDTHTREEEEEELMMHYGLLMQAAIRLGRGGWAVGVLDHVCRPNKVLYNTALHALAKQTPVDVVSVLSLLHSMLLHSSEGSLLFDDVSFNTAIHACTNAAFTTVSHCCADKDKDFNRQENSQEEEEEDDKAQAWHIGLDLLHVMSGVSPVPNPLHCPALITPLLQALHERGLKPPTPNAATYNTLMQACVGAGEGELALSLYASLPQPDVISHNLAIAAAGAAGRVELALSIVQPLLLSAKPNVQCVTSAIKACTQAARHKQPHHWMEQAERLLCVLESKGCADAPAYACLMTAFNRRGQGARVLSLFTRLRRHKLQPSPKVLTQVALASGSLGEPEGVLRSVQALAQNECLHALGTSGSAVLPLYALAACMCCQQEALGVRVRACLRKQGVVVDDAALQTLAQTWTTSTRGSNRA